MPYTPFILPANPATWAPPWPGQRNVYRQRRQANMGIPAVTGLTVGAPALMPPRVPPLPQIPRPTIPSSFAQGVQGAANANLGAQASQQALYLTGFGQNQYGVQPVAPAQPVQPYARGLAPAPYLAPGYRPPLPPAPQLQAAAGYQVQAPPPSPGEEPPKPPGEAFVQRGGVVRRAEEPIPPPNAEWAERWPRLAQWFKANYGLNLPPQLPEGVAEWVMNTPESQWDVIKQRGGDIAKSFYNELRRFMVEGEQPREKVPTWEENWPNLAAWAKANYGLNLPAQAAQASPWLMALREPQWDAIKRAGGDDANRLLAELKQLVAGIPPSQQLAQRIGQVTVNLGDPNHPPSYKGPRGNTWADISSFYNWLYDGDWLPADIDQPTMAKMMEYLGDFGYTALPSVYGLMFMGDTAREDWSDLLGAAFAYAQGGLQRRRPPSGGGGGGAQQSEQMRLLAQAYDKLMQRTYSQPAGPGRQQNAWSWMNYGKWY